MTKADDILAERDTQQEGVRATLTVCSNEILDFDDALIRSYFTCVTRTHTGILAHLHMFERKREEMNRRWI